jgi:CheY-like chemotaxis protein
VHLHGGTIEGASEGLGRGATFRVRLPWAPATLVPTSDPEATPTPTPAPPAPPLKDVVVLLVEDDVQTRDALAWVLSRADATVMTAGTASEALAALNDKKIDILVSDLGLPDVSGFELIALINDAFLKRGQRAPPACAVSAHARDVDRIRAIDAGFDMFLTKPITGKRLIEAVTDLRDVLSSRA